MSEPHHQAGRLLDATFVEAVGRGPAGGTRWGIDARRPLTEPAGSCYKVPPLHYGPVARATGERDP